MECAPIGCGGAVVTRLKGVFTGGFFLSATHVERAGPERDRERERERNQTGGRSIIASLPSLVISSAPSPSFIFFLLLLLRKNNTHFFFFFFFFFSVSEGTLQREARLFFFFSFIIFFLCGNGLLLFGRQNEQRSSGSQTGTVQWKYYLITPFALAALFLFFFCFFLSSVRPPAGGVENKPTRARRGVRAVGERRPTARDSVSAFHLYFSPGLLQLSPPPPPPPPPPLHLFTFLRLHSLTLQPLHSRETNEVGIFFFFFF